MEDSSSPPRAFVPDRLPWVIAFVMLTTYLATLNPWIAANSMETTAQLGGWDGSLMQTRPLLWLLGLPLRWVPEAKFPYAVNLLAAVFAAGAAGLVARCAALLPHDRTREQRVRGHSDRTMLHTKFAWAPPVFAAGLLGFQLTFWEQATAQTGEMLDLLVFAYCIRCLLEYRQDLRETWLWKFAFIYGAGLAGNWALVGFVPLAAVALVWIRGIAILDAGFLVRFVAWGAAGLTAYLILPLAGQMRSGDGRGFWDILHFNLVVQKSYLFGMPRGRFLLLALVNIAPLVLVGIRWTGTKGSSLERLMSLGAVVVMKFFCLAIAAYMAFDTAFSQRMMIHLDPQFGGIPLLTFHFTAALAAAYFLGYFLLVCGHSPEKSWERPSPGFSALSKLVFGLMLALTIGIPAALVARNFPVIRSNNGPALDHLVRSLVAPLPSKPAVVLVDDPVLNALLAAHLRRDPSVVPHLLVFTPFAPQPWYRERLLREHGARWPELAAFAQATEGVAGPFLQLVARASKNGLAFYLDPASNFILEQFQQRPVDSVFRLKGYEPRQVGPPPLTDEESAASVAYWTRIQSELEELATASRLGAVNAKQAAVLWARSVNTSGVYLQQAGRLDEAAKLFALARKLDGDSLAAEVNSRVNTALRAKLPITDEIRKPLVGRSLGNIFAEKGPVDEPRFLFMSARALEQSADQLARGAAIRFLRAHQLDPSFTLAALGYIGACLTAGEPTMALAAAADLRAKETLKLDDQAKLIRLEATALFRLGRRPEAEKLLLQARRTLPDAADPLDLLSQLYIESGRTDDALKALDQWALMQPDDATIASRRVLIAMGRNQFDQALPLLEKLVRQDPESEVARANRAICLLQTGKLDEARRDYEKLAGKHPERHIFQFGLGEIAERKKDTAAAIKHFERYIAVAPKDTAEYASVVARVARLKTGR